MSNPSIASSGSILTSHLMTLGLEVDEPASARIGATPKGYRSIAPITGGQFEGSRLSGRVVSGNDWVLIRDDTMDIDVRLLLETADKALIYLTYQGAFVGTSGSLARLNQGGTLSSDQYTLSTHARFECGDERYAWLNDVVAVGVGSQSGFNPSYEIFEIG